MSDLFGSPVGRSLAEKDMAALVMNAAQTQHLATQDAMAPFSAQQRSAQARWLNARSAGAESDAAIEKKVAALMQGDPPASAEEQQNPAWKVAGFYADAGAPTKAIKTANIAAGIDQKREAAATTQLRGQLIQSRNELINVDRLSREVRPADSPEALQAALVAHEQRTGTPTGFLDQRGQLLPQIAENWETVRDNIQEKAVGEKDRIATDLRERQLTALRGEYASRDAKRRLWSTLKEQEDLAAARQRGRGTKVGADVLTKPEGAKMGTNWVNSEFDGVNTDQAKIIGRKLSEQAAQLRLANPALTPTEAMDEAAKGPYMQDLLTGLKRKPPGAAASESRPLLLPPDGDKSKLKTGFWYTDAVAPYGGVAGGGASQGKRQWLGPDKGWGKHYNVKGKIGSASPLSMAPADDTSDEDETADDMAMGDEEN